MTISRFIAVPLFASFSLALSLALLTIKPEAPHGAMAIVSTNADPA